MLTEKTEANRTGKKKVVIQKQIKFSKQKRKEKEKGEIGHS